MQRSVCPVLVGREAELTLLEDTLLSANRGEGRIVLLGGEAGLGKTRLAAELRRRAHRIGMTVLWGGCSEAELALPYLPFLEAIGNYLATSDLQQIREQLGPLRHELAHLFPQLEPGAPVGVDGDPTQAKSRLFEAVMGLLRHPSADSGVLVVVEDLHWSDASTRELLDYMARRLAGLRMMILATYRSDELHRRHPLTPVIQGWRRSRATEVVELQPLALAGISQMVGAIFDEKEVTPEFAQFLHGKSEGNPFVLEELLKAALDHGDIYRGPAKWERKALSELRLPGTVRDTILLRVERLSEEQTDILQTAAVLGVEWSYHTLVAVAARDESVVQSALLGAVQQQLLEEVPGSNGRYRFRHALTRESIYDDMIAPRRELLHGHAADVLANQAATAAMDLAYHMFAANRWPEAISVGIKAAEDAEHNAAFQEAARVYERMLPHAGEAQSRGDLLCRLGQVHLLLLDPGRAQGYLEEGISLLESAGQRRVAAHYRLLLGRCKWERARPDLARSDYERAKADLEAEGPSEDLAVAYIRLAGLHLFDCDYENCLALAERAVAVAESANAESARIWARLFVGGALVPTGHPDEGLAMMDETFREAVARNLHWIARNALHNTIVIRCWNLLGADASEVLTWYDQLSGVVGFVRMFRHFDEGNIALYLGYPERARLALEKATALAREGESLTARRWILGALALALSALGRHQEALDCLVAPGPGTEMQDLVRYKQAKIALLFAAGDLPEAVAEALSVFERPRWGAVQEMRPLYDTAVEVLLAGGHLGQAEQLVNSVRQGPAVVIPHLDRMEGRIAVARGDLLEGRRRLGAALAGFQAARAGIEEMRTLRAIAEMEIRAGDRAAAERLLHRLVQIADQRTAIMEGQAARQLLSEIGIAAGPVPSAPDAPSSIELGERLVTVLFLDIRGYTPMSARLTPHELAETLANLYRWARQEVERHKGLVDKYEGDAVMATFNVTGSRLDHAVQALEAAVAIRDKAAAAGLPIGAAIAVGPAVVGQLAPDSQVSTFGQVTNLASRLQNQAGAGEILLSEEAFRRTSGWLQEQGISPSEDLVELKGFALPVKAFRLAPALKFA